MALIRLFKNNFNYTFSDSVSTCLINLFIVSIFVQLVEINN